MRLKCVEQYYGRSGSDGERIFFFFILYYNHTRFKSTLSQFTKLWAHLKRCSSKELLVEQNLPTDDIFVSTMQYDYYYWQCEDGKQQQSDIIIFFFVRNDRNETINVMNSK